MPTTPSNTQSTSGSDDTRKATESASERLDREAKDAKGKAKEAVETVKEEARGRVDDAKRAARGAAEEQKDAAATHIHDFARAVRSASDELSTRDQSFAARMVKEAADGLEKVSSSVSGTTVDDAVSSVTRFARSNPGAFLTGAVLAGVALGRFAKASSERDHDADELGYGSPAAAGTSPHNGGQRAPVTPSPGVSTTVKTTKAS